jgi:hypothetical protein
VNGDRDRVLVARFLEAARDLGYLRRRLEPESSAWFLAERLADHIESLDAMVGVSAGELAVEFFCICGDHQVAVEEALRVVDERHALVRGLLGRQDR